MPSFQFLLVRKSLFSGRTHLRPTTSMANWLYISRNISDTNRVTDFPLTREEAFSFLEDTLQISDWRLKLDTDPRNLLNTITQSMLCRIPFTNLPLVGQKIHFVTPSSFLEVKKAMFSRIGGGCVDFTMFTYALLSCLGYDCFICDSSYIYDPCNTNIHSAVIVRDLNGLGSRHLVDIGCGEPFFRSISLDFEKVSPIYCDDYLVYRFVRKNGTIVCQKMLSKNRCPEFNTPYLDTQDCGNKEWSSLLTYDVNNARDLQYLVKTRPVTVIPRYAFKFLLVIGFPTGKLRSVFNGTFYKSEDYGYIVKTKLATAEDELNVCIEKYPHLPLNMVKTVLFNSSRSNLICKYPGYRVI